MSSGNLIVQPKNFSCGLQIQCCSANGLDQNTCKPEKAEMNFHVGGYYRIELLKPNGDHFHIEGEYLEIKEPKRLVFSFHYTGLPQPPPDSKVTIFFEEENDKTSQLTLIQEFEVQPKEIENKTHNWEYMFSILQSVLNT